MGINSVLAPYPTFFDAAGLALENGYIYIGEPGFEARSTPKASFFDVALTIPTGTASGAAIRTKGGFPVNGSNAPSMFYADGDYSISICDRNGVLLYSALSMTLALNVGGAIGPVLAPDGSLGAVGIGFLDETDTGFIRSATETMQTVVGGVLVAQQTPTGTVFQQPVSGSGFSSGVLALAQAKDDDLTAIAAFGGTGIAVRTAANTWAQRQIVSADGSVTITNPAGVVGDIDLSVPGMATSSPVTLSGAPPQAIVTGLTGTPSYVELWFNGVSLTSTGNLFVQLGDSGGYVTTGYESSSQFNGSGQNATAGFIIVTSSATRAFTGSMNLRRTPGTNIWIATHNGCSDGGASYINGGGKVTLTGSLTQIRITASGGNDFDNSGTVYAAYR